KFCVPASPARIASPLNVVLAIVRVISWASCWYSASRLARSSAVLVALADCTASSRMRWAISPIWPREASAVCASEMPSLALRIATFMPRIWVFIRSAIARPAASSLALLTRRPEDRRCTAVASELLLVCRLRWALRDIRLVLITWDIGFSLASGDAWRHDAIGGVTPIGGKAGVVPTRFPSSGNRKRGPAGYHPVGPLRPWPSRGDQRRRLSTVFGMALACESIATPAC